MKLITLILLGLMVSGFTCSKQAPSQIGNDSSSTLKEFKNKLTLEEKVWLESCANIRGEVYCLRDLAEQKMNVPCKKE